MNEERGESADARHKSKTNSHKESDKRPFRLKIDREFIANHEASIILALFGAILVSPIFDFMNPQTKVWIVGAGIWCFVGIPIAWVCRSITNNMHAAIAPPIPNSSSSTQTSLPSQTDKGAGGPRFREQSAYMVAKIGTHGLDVKFDGSALNQALAPFMRVTSPNGQEIYPFRAYVENGVIYIDTTFFDGRNRVEMKKNVLIGKPDGWDFNYTDNAAEVVDKDGNPVFQLVYETPSTLVLTGAFYVDQDRMLVADQNLMVISIREAMQRRKNLRPIFKHPRWKYPGVYADGSHAKVDELPDAIADDSPRLHVLMETGFRPLMQDDPREVHLIAIKNNAGVLIGALDRIEQSIKRRQNYQKQKQQPGAVGDLVRVVLAEDSKRLDKYHNLRIALVHEVEEHLPEVRIPTLRDFTRTWRWDSPQPDRSKLVAELQEIEHHANLVRRREAVP